jgi:hypothetical protein
MNGQAEKAVHILARSQGNLILVSRAWRLPLARKPPTGSRATRNSALLACG